MLNLQIPEGINYECTGCGQCCLGWPVPVTEDDYQRIDGLDREELQLAAGVERLFQPLDSSDPGRRMFTRTLEKRSDGRCEFLTEDNRCQIHLKYGPEMKPSMCQLFPYTFTETPGGVFTSVAFVSTGALLNSGRPLAEQGELLEQKLQLYRRLLPDCSLDWSGIQLVDGVALSWDEYMQLDGELLELIKSGKPGRIDRKLLACSRHLSSRLPPGIPLERVPPIKARAKVVDQLLLKRFSELYMTDDPFACSIGDLFCQAFLVDLDGPSDTVRISIGSTICGFNQIYPFALGELDDESEDLLSRFVYCKIFGKSYFGPAFAEFSVLAGIHHLLLLVALVRLKIKIICIEQKRRHLDFLEIAEIVRNMDRRLTQVSYSRESAKILELFLSSPERMERLLSLSA